MKRSERTTLCESALKIRMFESQLKRKFELKWQKRQIEKLVSWTLPCWAALVLVIMLQSVADGQHLDNLDSRLLLWPASNLCQLVDNVWMRNTDVAKLVSLLFRSSAACRAGRGQWCCIIQHPCTFYSTQKLLISLIHIWFAWIQLWYLKTRLIFDKLAFCGF